MLCPEIFSLAAKSKNLLSIRADLYVVFSVSTTIEGNSTSNAALRHTHDRAVHRPDAVDVLSEPIANLRGLR
jgi:hypothetical protein